LAAAAAAAAAAAPAAPAEPAAAGEAAEAARRPAAASASARATRRSGRSMAAGVKACGRVSLLSLVDNVVSVDDVRHNRSAFSRLEIRFPRIREHCVQYRRRENLVVVSRFAITRT